MLSLNDSRWEKLQGGYRARFDPRPLLAQLSSGADAEGAWRGLRENLYHQGDVGEASYAVTPHLVSIHRKRGVVDWNTYAFVAAIELARDHADNPPVPAWLAGEYDQAIQDLAATGLAEFPRAETREAVRSILSVLALSKGARSYGRLLLDFTEDELEELTSSDTD